MTYTANLRYSFFSTKSSKVVDQQDDRIAELTAQVNRLLAENRQLTVQNDYLKQNGEQLEERLTNSGAPVNRDSSPAINPKLKVCLQLLLLLLIFFVLIFHLLLNNFLFSLSQ